MILVDVHEPEIIKSHFDGNVRSLPHADYWIIPDELADLSLYPDKLCLIGRVLKVERKTASDFVSSLLDNRLNDQLLNSDALIVEDDYALSVETIRTLRKALNTISWHTPVIHTKNQEETINELERIEKRFLSGELGVIRSEVKKRLKDRKNEPIINVYAQVPGIGEVYATKLAKEYPHIVDLVNALISNPDAVIKLIGKVRYTNLIQIVFGGDTKHEEKAEGTNSVSLYL
jgi:ERCC4-type nuclease